MSLEKILKSKLYVRITLAMLMLAATALVYFVGIKAGQDFASTRVLEYKFQDVSLDEVEKTVREVETPVKVMRSNDGKIVFFFQNLSSEDEKSINIKIGEKYQFISDMKKYEEMPVQDPLVRYKVVNILMLSFLGAVLIIFIRTREKLNLLGVAKITTVYLFSFLFEAVLFSGLAVIMGMIGLRFDFASVEIFILALLYSLVVKFVIFEFVVGKMKETGASMREAWGQAVSAKRKLISDSIIISLVGVVPSLIALSFLRNPLVLFIFTLPVLALSTFEVATNVLDVKLKK